jgi:dTDP-4-amino-4,6-dideoxygalactose transaminase
VWVRKRLDIGWGDLAWAAGRCLVPDLNRDASRRTETAWSPDGDALFCLSVRSGFDLLLTALDLPRGSEVLMSAITVPGMVRVAEAHGLVPVPVDLDPESAAADPASLARALSPASRLLVAAHLFGARPPLDPLLKALAASEHGRGLMVVEDCAQAWTPGYRGDARAAVSMFSFGLIKTATALGGALLAVRQPDLAARMRAAAERWPPQRRRVVFAKTAKAAAFKALSARPPYALITGLAAAAGRDHDLLVNRLAKGFPGPGFLERIRHRPASPLAALAARRLGRYDPGRLARRAAAGAALAAALPPPVSRPGRAAPHATYWVFPVLSDDPERTRRALARAGFDATRGDSLIVVEPPAGRPELEPVRARDLLLRTVYAPLYPELPRSALERMAAALAADAAAAGAPAADPPRAAAVPPAEA